MKPPKYLQDYEALWCRAPHAANLEWFKNARLGMFIHYGVYSQLGDGEWIMLRRKPPIPIGEYEQLAAKFNPEKFDADYITDLALEAQMSYINLTTCHHDGVCLWKSAVEPINTYALCGRDLVAELAEQCDRKSLGFFAYYTYIRNWRHPYSIPRELMPNTRPDYQFEEPRYLARTAADIHKYWEYVHACISELMDMPYPLTGIWLDGIGSYYNAPNLVPVKETYKLIRERRPDILLAFKQGATGTEDFAAPEHSLFSFGEDLREMGKIKEAEIAEHAWNNNMGKHNEICITTQRNGWGYVKDSEHISDDELWNNLQFASEHNCNLLANIAPLGNGSIHADEAALLKAIGTRIKQEGWPESVYGTPSEGASSKHLIKTVDINLM